MSEVILEHKRKTRMTYQLYNKINHKTPQVTNKQNLVLRHNGMNVRQPERFMFVGESSDLVLEEDETNPWAYEEAMRDHDVVS